MGNGLKIVHGIDSETINDEAGLARLVLIACSDGTHLTGNPITSERALKYITSRKGELWTFFGDYDVIFWLRDLPKSRLDELRRRNWCGWREFVIHHIPRRLFQVTNRQTGRTVKIFDAFPFVQSSFVRWLTDWKLADKRTLAHISKMKERRSDFASIDSARVLRYTQDEVATLSRGVVLLKQRIAAAARVPPQWLGPGAVAAAELRARKVKSHMPGKLPAPVLMQGAYFGGRIETAAVGMVRGRRLYSYDINSAYPWAASSLPCLAPGHGRWRRTTKFPLPTENALVRVSWDLPKGTIWGPFPVRHKVGESLKYPRKGSGWYWLPEVLPWADVVTIDRAIYWESDCGELPFAWVSDLYEKRQALKRAGDASEYALKLVLNSLYGKLAQRIGSRPFYCPVWAGLITARTRGRIGELLRFDYGKHVLIVATDGILSTRRLPFGNSRKLGAWSQAGTYAWADIWQPGFYVLDDGKPRTRGFSRHELDLEAFRDQWRQFGMLGQVAAHRERVVGYRLATAQNRMHDLGRWVKGESIVDFAPWPRRIPDELPTFRGGEYYHRTRAPETAEPDLDVSTLRKARKLEDYEDDGEPQGHFRD